MPEDRNTIARELSPEELDSFVERLASLPGRERTLAAIRAAAAERGIVISLESARTFRNTTFQRHVERMRRRKEKAQHLTALVSDGTGRTLNDANAAILAEQIFDELNTDADETGDDDEPARLDLEKLDAMTLAVSRLRRGDVQREALEAQLRESDAKVRALEAREKEREEKIKAAAKDLEKLRDPQSGLSDSERAAIVATVDNILGLKVTKKG